ncbi:MAG: hypothetical protein DKM50_03415 [Candidatus Margulisiibacteriota bacterium]|nr:MAG: hypothetical protein A2X43_09555 [Candidatus Margulisbacteria bacterium GWD2_39_127]OGI02865.1 MAG: hypothetical protein A2X42_02210 [Candidatus Margulisbacteria bacterium GWF2_38_17]OGI09646.1 MAG: hypothetical protein A2X41_04920 [Candidatus Margulisbacteria bacterium GWE2_39_32]PZM83028.1 MAG: hypothetical protein DKM50_03415 [Candidatus Margulisiibacteriota bacterium]HAR62188.1 hypothetical protein [Candidatus Margulisiibacteriota bacterium]
MGRKKHHEEAEEGWITSYADLMTNLFAFFLVLFIFATNSKEETNMSVVLQEIRTGFLERVDKKAAKVLKDELKKAQTPSMPQVDSKKAEIAKKVEKVIIEQQLKNYVHIIIEEKKIRIVFTDPVIFKTGKAELNPQAKKILKEVASILKPIPNPIFVEGHTDNVPIHNKEYDSNWELSFSRAYSIIKYLQKVENIPPDRLSGTGYGEYKPLAGNDTNINRAKNRRIEINVIFFDEKKSEETSGKTNNQATKAETSHTSKPGH